MVLRKPEVVVRSEVDALRLSASEFKSPAVVVRDAILEHQRVTWHTRYRSVPTILHSTVNIVEVKTLKTIKQRRVSISIFFGCNFRQEKELIDVSDEDKQVEAEVGEACRYQRRFFEALFGLVGCFVLVKRYLQKWKLVNKNDSRSAIFMCRMFECLIIATQYPISNYFELI